MSIQEYDKGKRAGGKPDQLPNGDTIFEVINPSAEYTAILRILPKDTFRVNTDYGTLANSSYVEKVTITMSGGRFDVFDQFVAQAWYVINKSINNRRKPKREKIPLTAQENEFLRIYNSTHAQVKSELAAYLPQGISVRGRRSRVAERIRHIN